MTFESNHAIALVLVLVGSLIGSMVLVYQGNQVDF